MRGPTTFERRVWAEVQRIGWGETKTYGEVAKAAGSGPLAIGTALSRLDRFPDMEAVVPWHRVTKARYGGNKRLAPINDRTREQAQRLVLEGHVLEQHGNTYRLIE